MTFLASLDPIGLSLSPPAGFTSDGLFLGHGDQALEVALLRSDRKPTVPELKKLQSDRAGGRATPVLVAVLHGRDRAAIATVLNGEPMVHQDLERGLVERICLAAPACPDRHQAQRSLLSSLSQLSSPVPGLRNEWLFALHQLVHGVPTRSRMEGCVQFVGRNAWAARP